MGAMFHFIFLLIKIAILSSVYALILLIVFSQIKKSKPESWFQKVTADKKGFWLSSWAIIYIMLFFYMFTYWGNHGFGDSAKIPIGNGYLVKNINWTEYAFVENVKTADGKILGMTKFLVLNDKLLGNLNDNFSFYENRFFLLDMNTGELQEFKTKQAFETHNKKNGLPNAIHLKSFNGNYHDYWGGWRFVLLP